MPRSAIAQESAGQSAKDVEVRIETRKTTYRPGERVLVRLTLHSTSATPVQFYHLVPSALVQLRVTDHDGRRLTAVDSSLGQWFGGIRLAEIELKGGEERTLKYGGEEWMDLRDWGYDLKAVGEYAITGSPRVSGPSLKPDSIRSNEANITLKP